MSWKFTELNFPKRRKILYPNTGHYTGWKNSNRLTPNLTVYQQYVALPNTFTVHIVFREINGNEIAVFITGEKKTACKTNAYL